jgi:uracil phosphoribosyltransferase
MFVVELMGDRGLYERMKEPSVTRSEVRQHLIALGHVLAMRAKLEIIERMAGAERILCAILLRGGLLLYPGFVAEFPRADFCLLGMSRHAGSARCEYQSRVRRADHELIIYLDCVVASGGTIRAATEVLASLSPTAAGMAACICASEVGVIALQGMGLSVMGFSLHEGTRGPLVVPDLGALDAGELSAGDCAVSRTPTGRERS